MLTPIVSVSIPQEEYSIRIQQFKEILTYLGLSRFHHYLNFTTTQQLSEFVAHLHSNFFYLPQTDLIIQFIDEPENISIWIVSGHEFVLENSSNDNLRMKRNRVVELPASQMQIEIKVSKAL